MSPISPGSQIKFYTTVCDIHHNTYHMNFLSGTVQEDNGNYVTVWTNDGRTFHVPHGFITEIQDPNDSFTYSPTHASVPPPAVSFNELISTL